MLMTFQLANTEKKNLLLSVFNSLSRIHVINFDIIPNACMLSSLQCIYFLLILLLGNISCRPHRLKYTILTKKHHRPEMHENSLLLSTNKTKFQPDNVTTVGVIRRQNARQKQAKRQRQKHEYETRACRRQWRKGKVYINNVSDVI